MRFYLTWGFQRTLLLGSHITSDNTGSWVNQVERDEGGLKQSAVYYHPAVCPPSSSNTKESSAMPWPGVTSFHIGETQRGVKWYPWQGTDSEGESEAEHTKIGSVRKTGSQMTCILIPKCKIVRIPMQSVTIFTQIFQGKDIFRVIYSLRSRSLWCCL